MLSRSEKRSTTTLNENSITANLLLRVLTRPIWTMHQIIMTIKLQWNIHPQIGCLKAIFTLVKHNGQQGKLMKRKFGQRNIYILLLILYTAFKLLQYCGRGRRRFVEIADLTLCTGQIWTPTTVENGWVHWLGVGKDIGWNSDPSNVHIWRLKENWSEERTQVFPGSTDAFQINKTFPAPSA